MFSGLKKLTEMIPLSAEADSDDYESQFQPALGDDEKFMARAFNLAAKGINTTHPNPRVGCVIVYNGKVVGEGWHRFAGQDHAEVIALAQAGKQARGGTLYVTLEPCNHRGRTPACTDAIIRSGVNRAVVAIEDPNPLVNGGGISTLRHAGIDVSVGVGQERARLLNRGFFKRMLNGMPWVTLKIAVSLDGRTAMANGDSKWITGEAARKDAHKLRASSSAILTGIGTVLRDDPEMTARLDEVERQPIRIILDSNLSTPLDARILKTPGNVLIVTTPKEDVELEPWISDSVEVITCMEKAGQVDLTHMMRQLGEREINELMLEAGAQLSGNMLKQGLVDEMIVYMAPDLLGGHARGMCDIPGIETMAEKYRLSFRDVRRVGGDLRLVLDVVKSNQSA